MIRFSGARCISLVNLDCFVAWRDFVGQRASLFWFIHLIAKSRPVAFQAEEIGSSICIEIACFLPHQRQILAFNQDSCLTHLVLGKSHIQLPFTNIFRQICHYYISFLPPPPVSGMVVLSFGLLGNHVQYQPRNIDVVRSRLPWGKELGLQIWLGDFTVNFGTPS